LKEHLISPFTTGYEGTAIESLYERAEEIGFELEISVTDFPYLSEPSPGDEPKIPISC